MKTLKRHWLVSKKEAQAKLTALIAEQETKPIDDIDALIEEAKGIWPEDESADEFVEWRRKRREESRRRS